MKKLTAISLLAVFILNMGGYALVFKYFIHESDVQIVNKMYDSRFNSAQLIELKIPVNMPTQQDWAEYEHVEGQIQVNGNYYNYVKLKMTRDTLSLLCLPNTVKKNLVKGNILITKELNDNPLNKKGANSPEKKAESIYDHVYQVINCDYTAFEERLPKMYDRTGVPALSSPYIESPGKPPNTAC
ncbi:MAG: hypothetical protein JST32_11650 [Bacteroidetes bacterium]|nr:hypothetical protein [Bacteroidota bacterium]